jgi:hypothetical protein
MDFSRSDKWPRNSIEEMFEQLRMQRERWEQEQKEMRREWREYFLTAAAVLAALFAAWQGYEAHKVRIDADRAAEQARQDTKNAAAEARKDAKAAMQLQLDAARASEAQADRSAKAAEASASVAMLSLHISERAYVDVDAGLTSTLKAGEKLGFQAIVSNSGRTPGLDVVTKARSGFAPASDIAEHAHSVAFGASIPVTYTSKGIISPGGKLQTTWQTQEPLTQVVVDGLTNHQITLYVFADVTYKDVFHRSHETKFCAFFDPATHTLLRCDIYVAN